MLCFLADWMVLSLPPGVSDYARTEVWDKEYDYIKKQYADDVMLFEVAKDCGYNVTPEEN